MKWLVLVLSWLCVTQAEASPVVADLSTYRIAIDAGFNGIRVFVFGARNDAGDVMVVIRGPQKEFTVRKKERVAGMWINRKQVIFRGVPDFYAVAATHPLDTLENATLRHSLGIGEDTLLAAPAGEYNTARIGEFSEALLAHERARGLYPALLPLSFMGETLFKTVVPFPDTIPRGEYTAEIYLISDGALVGMQVLPIHVEKSGLDAFLFDLAHHAPLLYGLLAITLALGAGWLADRLFAHT